MSTVKLRSASLNYEVLNYYYFNPFKSTNLLWIPLRIILLPLVLIHFFTKLFFMSDLEEDIIEDAHIIAKIVFWPFKIIFLLVGIAFGIALIPLQLVTFVFSYLYFKTSARKYPDYL